VLELAARLHAEMSMMVCCLDDAGTWACGLGDRGIEVHALRRAPGFRPALGRAIARIAAKHEATVIHAHHYSPFVYSCLARVWRPGTHVVFTEHGRLSDAPPSRKRMVANRVLARFPGRIFAVSEDLKRHLVQEGFGPHAVEVVYNGINAGPPPDAGERARARQQVGAAPDTVVIGTVARLDPVKDVATLLRAAAQLIADVPAMLVVVGDGPERLPLERLTSDLGIQSHVRFLGYRDDVRTLLAGFDVYANSSISEGVSLTILEAMAARLPVVATRVGGTPEVVDETCGRLVSARNADDVAASLRALACRPLDRRALGDAGRRRVESRFTVDRMAREYRDVYASVAERAY